MAKLRVGLVGFALLVGACSAVGNEHVAPGIQTDELDVSNGIAFADVETGSFEGEGVAGDPWMLNIPVTWRYEADSSASTWVVDPVGGARRTGPVVFIGTRAEELMGDEWLRDRIDLNRLAFEARGRDATVTSSTFSGTHHNFHVVTIYDEETDGIISTASTLSRGRSFNVSVTATRPQYDKFLPEILAVLDSVEWTPPE